MSQQLKILFGLQCLLALLVACGPYSPIVDSKKDVQRLAPSEEVIRCRGLSDEDIPSLTHLPRLKQLYFGAGHLAGPAKITDKGLARLAQLDLPRLENLSLGYCSNITDRGLLDVSTMQTLTMLSLSFCPKITDTGLAYVSRMKKLNWLHLAVCPQITDAGLPTLLAMTNLIALDLRGCPAITDRGLEHLAAKTNWQVIMLGGCPNVTVEAVERLQRALPNARVKKDEKEWSHHK
jgi:hypothetical protein